mmetsp:Transcript_11549/g.26020  ORF Transcript_11549/g.26020 Transcript_11549/m.26020 type:complete len:117 (-) Transcript_11549:143-493(-)
MVPVRPVAAANAAPGRGRQRRRRRGAAARPAVNLPNDINAPTARIISYYKLFLEFMNYRHNNVLEYGCLFSDAKTSAIIPEDVYKWIALGVFRSQARHSGHFDIKIVPTKNAHRAL